MRGGRAGLVALAISVLAACDSNQSGGDGPATLQSDLTSVPVIVGQASRAAIRYVPNPVGRRPVALTITGLPDGVHGTLPPNTVGETEERVELTLSADEAPRSRQSPDADRAGTRVFPLGAHEIQFAAPRLL
jgi:hypothetical protein